MPSLPTVAPPPSLAASTPVPTPAPSSGAPSQPVTPPDSTPVVAGVVSAVAGVALIAVAAFLKRRRTANQKIANPPPAVLAAHDDDNLEQGREQPPDAHPPAVLAVGDGDDQSPLTHKASPHRHTPAEADESDGEGVVPPSAPASLDIQVQSSTEQANDAPIAADAAADAAKDREAGLAGEDAAGGSTEKSSPTTTSIATASTANMSTAERDEVAQFHQWQRAADAAPVAGKSQPEKKQEKTSGGGIGDSSEPGRQNSAGDIGLGNAVLAAAQELARHCQIPGVSEAAAAVCIMANMVTDSRENDRASESRLRQCRTIVLALKRAAKVAEKVSGRHFVCSKILVSFEPGEDSVVAPS